MKDNNQIFESILNIRKSITEEFFVRSENANKHNSYEQELREIESIENGDEIRLLNALKEVDESQIGILAKDPVRHHKNVAIGNVTLASRAAIRGGVSVEEAFSMADIFIQQIEKMSDVDEIIAYKTVVKMVYARAVKVIREKGEENKNPLIKEVKNYIFTHMHEAIKVNDIAAYFHVNADYLSHLFSICEKKTIKQYVLEEKIARSKNLLRFSEYKIQEIAFYLGFSSQSHFTKIFREIVGMNPNEFRKKYGNVIEWKV